MMGLGKGGNPGLKDGHFAYLYMYLYVRFVGDFRRVLGFWDAGQKLF